MTATATKWQQIVEERGLDVSVVSCSDTERLDAEYYRPHCLILGKKIQLKPNKSIEQSFDVTKLAGFEYTKYFTKKNIECEVTVPVLTSLNIQSEKLVIDGCLRISQDTASRFLSRSKLLKGDVVFSYTGEYRRALTLRQEGCQLGPNICLIRPKKESNLLSEFLSTFLNSKVGQTILDQEKTLSGQPTVAMSRIRKIKLPIPSNYFQKTIADLVIQAHQAQENSKTLYAEAESLLLSELGLQNWTPDEANTTIKSSEEVNLYGRADAEFFQPKYDELFERIEKVETKLLDEIVDYKKGVEPGSAAYSESGIPFVRVSDVSVNGIHRIEKMISSDLVKSYKGKYSPKAGEILFTKDGTIGISCVVNEDSDSVLSGAFLRFLPKVKIEAEYLALVLNSIICKLQIERFSGGAIIAHLKPSDALQLKIPTLPSTTQETIANKVTESREARQHSEKLLEVAKRAVEIYIEEDEAAAEAYINKSL